MRGYPCKYLSPSLNGEWLFVDFMAGLNANQTDAMLWSLLEKDNTLQMSNHPPLWFKRGYYVHHSGEYYMFYDVNCGHDNYNATASMSDDWKAGSEQPADANALEPFRWHIRRDEPDVSAAPSLGRNTGCWTHGTSIMPTLSHVPLAGAGWRITCTGRGPGTLANITFEPSPCPKPSPKFEFKWSPWSDKDAACGNGYRTEVRSCPAADNKCGCALDSDRELRRETRSKKQKCRQHNIQISGCAGFGDECAGINGEWMLLGDTTDGRPHYMHHAGLTFLHYDRDCDGSTGDDDGDGDDADAGDDRDVKNDYSFYDDDAQDNRWFFTHFPGPFTAKDVNLDGNRRCEYVGRSKASTLSHAPESGGKWIFWFNNKKKITKLDIATSTCASPAPAYTYRWTEWTDVKFGCGNGFREEVESCTAHQNGCGCAQDSRREVKSETRSTEPPCYTQDLMVSLYNCDGGELYEEFSYVGDTHDGRGYYVHVPRLDNSTTNNVHWKYKYMFYDSESGCHAFNNRWIVTDKKPNTSLVHDLDEDDTCVWEMNVAVPTTAVVPPSGSWDLVCTDQGEGESPESSTWRKVAVTVAESTCDKPSPPFEYTWSKWSDEMYSCGEGERHEREACPALPGCNCDWGSRRPTRKPEFRSIFTTCNVVLKVNSNSASSCASYLEGEWIFQYRLSMAGNRVYARDADLHGGLTRWWGWFPPGSLDILYMQYQDYASPLIGVNTGWNIGVRDGATLIAAADVETDVVPPLLATWKVFCGVDRTADLSFRIQQSDCAFPPLDYTYTFPKWKDEIEEEEEEEDEEGGGGGGGGGKRGGSARTNADNDVVCSTEEREEIESCLPGGVICGCNIDSKRKVRKEFKSSCNFHLSSSSSGSSRSCRPGLDGEWIYVGQTNAGRKYYAKDLGDDQGMHYMYSAADPASVCQARAVDSSIGSGLRGSWSGSFSSGYGRSHMYSTYAYSDFDYAAYSDDSYGADANGIVDDDDDDDLVFGKWIITPKEPSTWGGKHLGATVDDSVDSGRANADGDYGETASLCQHIAIKAGPAKLQLQQGAWLLQCKNTDESTSMNENEKDEWAETRFVITESKCSIPLNYTYTPRPSFEIISECANGEMKMLTESENCSAVDECSCHPNSKRALKTTTIPCISDSSGPDHGGGGGSSSAADASDNGAGTNSDGSGANPKVTAGVAAAAVLLVIVAGVGWIVVKRRRRAARHGADDAAEELCSGVFSGCYETSHARRTRMLASELKDATLEKAQLHFLSKYSRRLFSDVTSAEEYGALVSKLELGRKNMQFGQTLGEGNYGTVNLAKLKVKSSINGVLSAASTLSTAHYHHMAVAVKACHSSEDGVDAMMNEALLTEAFVLFALRHEYVLGLVGICTDKFPFLLITEYMANGDLRSLLRDCRPNNTPGAPVPKATLTMLDVSTIVEKVARALAYLESVFVVHRDVAARNVLVGKAPTDVKLGDLGAARSVFRDTQREYTATSDHTPVRWMAIESLMSATFSNKSDVWAWGVFCWEVCTLGQRPYGEIGMKDMIDSLKKGNRLLEPTSAPPGLYKVLRLCWQEEPKRRPRFADLVHQVGSIRGALAVTAEGFRIASGQTNPADGRAAAAGTLALGAANGAAASAATNNPYSVCTPLQKSTKNNSSSSSSNDSGGGGGGSEYYDNIGDRVNGDEYEIIDENASPLRALASVKLVDFKSAVAAAEANPYCRDLKEQMENALHFARGVVANGMSFGLTLDQIASIHLYTQESPFYKALNGALGGWGKGGRAAVVHFLPYIKLVCGALDLLPKVTTVVYRGIKNVAVEAVLNGAAVGDTLHWWAFTSTTGTPDVLRDPSFFGIGEEEGNRVVFKIQVKNGVRIKTFSDLGNCVDDYLIPFGVPVVQNEDEVVLRPGTALHIDSITQYDNNVTEIAMHEVDATPLPGSSGNGGVTGGAGGTGGTGGGGGGGGGVGWMSDAGDAARSTADAISSSLKDAFAPSLNYLSGLDMAESNGNAGTSNSSSSIGGGNGAPSHYLSSLEMVSTGLAANGGGGGGDSNGGVGSNGSGGKPEDADPYYKFQDTSAGTAGAGADAGAGTARRIVATPTIASFQHPFVEDADYHLASATPVALRTASSDVDAPIPRPRLDTAWAPSPSADYYLASATTAAASSSDAAVAPVLRPRLNTVWTEPPVAEDKQRKTTLRARQKQQSVYNGFEGAVDNEEEGVDPVERRQQRNDPRVRASTPAGAGPRLSARGAARGAASSGPPRESATVNNPSQPSQPGVALQAVNKRARASVYLGFEDVGEDETRL